MVATILVRRPHLWAALLFLALAVPSLAQTPPVPPTTPSTVPTPVKWLVNGYVQARAYDTIGDTKPGVFDARRFYINLRVDVDEHLSAGALASGVPITPISIYEAYAEYRFNPMFKTRAGLYRLPFGYEIPVSSAGLITLERSQVVNMLLYQNYNFDRGVFAYLTPANKPYNLSVALVDGLPNSAPVSTTTSNHKNVVSRVGYTFTGVQIGASVYSGQGQDELPMERIGYDVQAKRGAFVLQSEGIKGRGQITGYTDTQADGMYVTLAYREGASAYQPYLRYDTFNPNTEVVGNNYQRYTAGVNYFLRGNNKLTLEYQAIDDDAAPAVDSFIGAQYQVTF